ncbi:hypothetical protein BDQ12DRAFT_599931 [Crucibulum laeve]|uniref:HTH La-type RNA-binding domain-containing protein n=1 Tax=Crucibulum laeve TaxID=68775 RepID=A0A5C3M9K0_9AGAR|nr:hypothetical protein BDQ12DRAFT_599931 [Crucibulum laeve]
MYIPTGFENYQLPVPPTPVLGQQQGAPVPVPQTVVSFPLDPTRWYLLGQLEYYLSPQNMAQDFYLRQHMDSQGWIPISLIALFNRVRKLTTDEQIVKDMLILSSLVQVKDSWVRMNGWECFVLPDAALSIVDTIKHQPLHAEASVHHALYEEQSHDTSRDVHEPQGSEHEEESRGGSEGGISHDVQDDTNLGTDVDGYEDEEDEEDVIFVMEQDTAMWIPERRG